MEHDIEELDFARDNVKLRAVVKSTEDAQKVADQLKTDPCFKDVKIQQITAVPNKELQKYSMEFSIRCEEEKPAKKPAEGAEAEEG
jgi:predicted RNA binding protein with dsRBD fold (UPF0201 family)